MAQRLCGRPSCSSRLSVEKYDRERDERVRVVDLSALERVLVSSVTHKE